MKIKTSNLHKILVILLHSFIFVGAGHGIGFLIFFDLIGIPALFSGTVDFNLNANYEDRIPLVALISSLGKIFLIVSIFLRPHKMKQVLSILGLLFLWLALYILTSGNWTYNNLFEFSFWSSIPFLVFSVILAFDMLLAIISSKSKS